MYSSSSSISSSSSSISSSSSSSSSSEMKEERKRKKETKAKESRHLCIYIYTTLRSPLRLLAPSQEKSYVFALQNHQSNVSTKFARRGFRTTPISTNCMQLYDCIYQIAIWMMHRDTLFASFKFQPAETAMSFQKCRWKRCSRFHGTSSSGCD